MDRKVSVVIPVHNSQKYLKECLDSVVNQTYSNLEIIVIDDASEDDSVSIVNSLNDDRIILIRLSENKGVSIARNKGIEIATGDYLCFIDADDVWKNDKIEKQIRFIANSGYSFIYSNYIFLKYDIKNQVKYRITKVPRKLSYEEAIKNTTIFISTVMIDLRKVKKEYIYMPDLQIGQDTAAWWQVLKQGFIAYGMDDALAYYRVHTKSLSSNKIKAVLGAWKIYLRQDIGMFKRVFCFSCYLKNAIKRRI